MSVHVVLGKGPIGRTLATHLANTGAEVIVVSRSGAGGAPTIAGVRHVAADVTDADRLTELTTGATTVTCCVNPPYHRWPTEWPPVVDALVTAAARTGAVVVMAGNLYAYGPTHQTMREDTPLDTTESKGVVRAQMWTRLAEAHARGEIRATEVRGSDYLGPGAGAGAHAGDRLLKPLLAGKAIRPIGAADQPHSWTYLPDFARALAVAGATEAAWGSAWHVPSPEPLTFRELADRFAAAAGLPAPRISPMPVGMLRALGVAVPMLRELARTSYQFTAPFIVDSTRSQELFGFAPTPWETVVEETLAAERG